MAGEELIATLDVAPHCLAEFAPIIAKVCKVIGSEDCSTTVRLLVMVPAEYGPRVQIAATKKPDSILFELVSAA